MNLSFSSREPVGKLLTDAVLVFRPSRALRPTGGVFYRVLLESFGLDPLPYRLAQVGLLVLNIVLTFLLASRLSSSRAIGLVAALLHAYHLRFFWLYLNIGHCYDVLAYTFFCAALLYYDSVRRRGQPPGAVPLVVFALLTSLALSAKEIAVSLPLVALAGELFLYRQRSWRGPLLAAGLNLALIFGRLLGPSGLLENPSYQPKLDPLLYPASLYRYFRGWLFDFPLVTPVTAVLLLAAVILWSRREPHLRVWLVLAIAGIAPIAFVTERGIESAYLPLLGVSAVLATALVRWAEFVLPRREALLFPLLPAALLAVHDHARSLLEPELTRLGDSMTAFAIQLRDHSPPFRAGASLLILADPWPDNPFGPVLIASLVFRRQPPHLVRAAQLPAPLTADILRDYEYAIAWDGERLIWCKPDAVATCDTAAKPPSRAP